MTTTIQIRETTKQLLNRVKIQEGKETYDQVIEHILKKHITVDDMFGYAKRKPIVFKKSDEMDFNEI